MRNKQKNYFSFFRGREQNNRLKQWKLEFFYFYERAKERVNERISECGCVWKAKQNVEE